MVVTWLKVVYTRFLEATLTIADLSSVREDQAKCGEAKTK